MKSEMEEYPLEAMKAGTFVRTNRLNRLGIITDAFYGEKDQDDQPNHLYYPFVASKQPYKEGAS